MEENISCYDNLSELTDWVTKSQADYLYDGWHIKLYFDNGYGADIVRHSFSQGNEAVLWDLTVTHREIDGNGESVWELCHDTPITDDILEHLNESDVIEVCQQIKDLDPNINYAAEKEVEFHAFDDEDFNL